MAVEVFGGIELVCIIIIILFIISIFILFFFLIIVLIFVVLVSLNRFDLHYLRCRWAVVNFIDLEAGRPHIQ